jgi:P4 family phage/plasmid primase-like protien
MARSGTHNRSCSPCRTGVLNLDPISFRPGSTYDYVTKVAPVIYDAGARCPRFERFLAEVFADTPEIVDYLQRCIGYCLTALTSEQVFWILWGLGSNGKSTLIEVLQSLFGPYAWTMPFPTSTWTAAISEYQRAELPGRRFVTASEVSQRGHLHEEFIKGLTGSDTVNARQIYGRPFTFTPVAKFWLRCNDRPVIKDLTHSMWRRVKLIPFTQTFTVDTTLTPMLMAELPGILNWVLEGCRLWRREGLYEPTCVQAATAEYREASDVLSEFVDDRCHVMTGCSVGGRELFAAYQSWEAGRGTSPDQRLSQKTFGLRVKARFPDIGTSRKVVYSGLGTAHRGAAKSGVRTNQHKITKEDPPEGKQPFLLPRCARGQRFILSVRYGSSTPPERLRRKQSGVRRPSRRQLAAIPGRPRHHAGNPNGCGSTASSWRCRGRGTGQYAGWVGVRPRSLSQNHLERRIFGLCTSWVTRCTEGGPVLSRKTLDS